MTQTIKLTLSKSLIMETVKNDTFRRGRFDNAADPKATAAAYEEQAGDDEYHERTLARALYTSLEELKSYLSDYITPSGGTTGDNISSYDQSDNIIIQLVVGARFNTGYTQSLARLSSRFIENSMLALWWTPINEKQATFYTALAEKDLAAIKRCFNKTAPVAPTNPYTEYITTTGTTVELEVGDSDTITYTISDNAIDDIEASVSDGRVVSIGRSSEGFLVNALRTGHSVLTMYSRHDTDITASIDIYVVEGE